MKRSLLGLAVSVPPLAVFLLLYFTYVFKLEYTASWVSNPLVHEGDPIRLMTAPMLWVHGLYRVVAPFDLACDYGPHVFPLVRSPGDPRLWLSALLLVAVVVGGVLAVFRQPLLFLAMASFFGFSIIVSNLLFGLETIFAERLYYTPSLGLSFLVVWLVQLIVYKF